MGCDIHAYIEFKNPDSDFWESFGGRIYPARDYAVFAALAGVRNWDDSGITPIATPRGIPVDAGYSVTEDNQLYISDDDPRSEGNCSRESAERYVASCGCKIVKEHWVTHPDWHSHSWVSPTEFEAVLEAARKARRNLDVEYVVLLATLRAFEQQGCEARLVFWFDN